MGKRWRRAEVIVVEGGNWRFTPVKLVSVSAEIVVEDGSEYLATFMPLGTPYFTCDEPERTSMPIEERIRLYGEHMPRSAWYERSNRRAVLSLRQHEAAHSIRLFWDEDWRLNIWYVNLEAPYRRTAKGIGVFDHALDILVSPALEWQWKDEEEFEAMCRAGLFSEEEARAIRAEGERVIGRIERHEWPFNDPWPDWRPDPRWPVPKISDYWTPP